jgi:hypothetical protein
MPDIQITTLRTACPDGRTCPAVHAVVGRPAVRYIVGRVPDTATVAAFADRVGPGEAVVEVPTDLLPEV